MLTRVTRAAPLCAAALLLLPASALAHAVCGARVFPVTLTFDDPGVGDEASLPTITYQHFGQNTDSPGNLTTLNLEYDKRITENFALGVNGGYSFLGNTGDKNQSGYQNFVLTAKYQTCVTADHEFMVSLGVQQELGGTGTTRNGADQYGATAPTLYFGKGMGDLPVPLLRPFAITGELSYAISNRALKLNNVTDPDSGMVTTQSNNGNSNAWAAGVSLQYSLPYLQSQVKDYGLPPFLAHMIPVVEFTWVSPASAPTNTQTAWVAAPGVLYEGDWYQVGVEALIPLTRSAGTNVGVIAQFHMFLDDLLPNSLGKPLVEWFR